MIQNNDNFKELKVQLDIIDYCNKVKNSVNLPTEDSIKNGEMYKGISVQSLDKPIIEMSLDNKDENPELAQLVSYISLSAVETIVSKLEESIREARLEVIRLSGIVYEEGVDG